MGIVRTENLDTAKKAFHHRQIGRWKAFCFFLFRALILVVETEQDILIIVAESLTV